jgi:hypothetical protein
MNAWVKNNKTSRKKLLHGESVIVKNDSRVDFAYYCNIEDCFKEPYFGQPTCSKHNGVTHFMLMPTFP